MHCHGPIAGGFMSARCRRCRRAGPAAAALTDAPRCAGLVDWRANRLAGCGGNVYQVAFDAAGALLLSADDTRARVWRASDGQELCRFTHPTDVLSVAWSPGGAFVSGCGDGAVRVFDIDAVDVARAAGAEPADCQARRVLGDGDAAAPERKVDVVQWAPNGWLVASAGDDGVAQLLNASVEVRRHGRCDALVKGSTQITTLSTGPSKWRRKVKRCYRQ